MTEPITLRLPLPPSINHYWRHRIAGSGRTAFVSVYVSAEGKQFREDVAAIVATTLRPHRTIIERVRVTIDITPKDRRSFDIDNRIKAVLDALTHANVWADDSQVDHLTVIRGPVQKPGGIVVTIETIPRVAEL